MRLLRKITAGLIAAGCGLFAAGWGVAVWHDRVTAATMCEMSFFLAVDATLFACKALTLLSNNSSLLAVTGIFNAALGGFYAFCIVLVAPSVGSPGAHGDPPPTLMEIVTGLAIAAVFLTAAVTMLVEARRHPPSDNEVL